MILTIISLLLIGSYTAALCIKEKGIPQSISATYYALKHKFWFGFTMIGTAFLLLPSIINISSPNTQFMAFLACSGIALVGVSPNFREEFEGKIHEIGAVTCLAFSQLWVGFNNAWFLLPWITYILYTIIYMIVKWDGNFYNTFLRTRPMFWVEVFALLTTYLLLFNL